MSGLDTFRANLAHAIATGETVEIGGGRFDRAELVEIADAIAGERKARDAAQARANNAELESKRWLAAFDRQLEKFSALPGEHAELVAAVATIARFAAKESDQ